MVTIAELGRIFLVLGLVLAGVGVVLMFAGRLPGLERLPGDLVFQRGRWTVFVPLGTMIVLSLLLTLLLNLFNRR